METITVKSKKSVEGAWRFLVEVGDTNFHVEVEKDYWRKLTDEKITPEKFVEHSFRFLLEREPKSSILREFNVRVINNYFPEYESVLRNTK